jgi:hypothetical protein
MELQRGRMYDHSEPCAPLKVISSPLDQLLASLACSTLTPSIVCVKNCLHSPPSPPPPCLSPSFSVALTPVPVSLTVLSPPLTRSRGLQTMLSSTVVD